MPIVRTGATPERLALAKRVAELRAAGLKHREIAAEVGRSRSYVAELLVDPHGEKGRARKDIYSGTCIDCGARTSGADGRAQAPGRCSACAHAVETAERTWTREAVIDAIQRFAAAHGRPPTSTEWMRSDPANGYPPRSAVYKSGHDSTSPFDKWGDAIEAAGFPRPRVGHYRDRHRGDYRVTHLRGESVTMRNYVVLVQGPDGTWTAHEGIQGHTEQSAIENYVESLGETNGAAGHRYVAISEARWLVRELKQVTSFRAVPVEA